MKKIIIITLIAAMLLCFAGCAKLVSTETQEVEATVTDVCYEERRIQPVFTGKTVIMISHPARYEVTFTYKNVTLTVNDEDIYSRYKDQIGTTVKCDLITDYYDDGSTRQTLKLKEVGDA